MDFFGGNNCLLLILFLYLIGSYDNDGCGCGGNNWFLLILFLLLFSGANTGYGNDRQGINGCGCR